MKTLKTILACALFLAVFAACTDDFSTPTAGDRNSVISDEVKPGDDATAGGDVSGTGGDDKDEKEDPTAGDEDSKPGN
jgi:hypothetical protein